MIFKVYPFTGVNYFWLIFYFCQKIWFFHIGHDEQVNSYIKPGSFVAVAAPPIIKGYHLVHRSTGNKSCEHQSQQRQLQNLRFVRELFTSQNIFLNYTKRNEI